MKIIVNQLNQLILFPLQNGINFLKINEILYCKSESNYSEIISTKDRCFMVSMTLKQIEESISNYGFIRIHRSYLVNINHINNLRSGKSHYLILSDGTKIPVSKIGKTNLNRLLKS